MHFRRIHSLMDSRQSGANECVSALGFPSADFNVLASRMSEFSTSYNMRAGNAARERKELTQSEA